MSDAATTREWEKKGNKEREVQRERYAERSSRVWRVERTTHTSCAANVALQRLKQQNVSHAASISARPCPCIPPSTSSSCFCCCFWLWSGDRSHAANCGNPHFHALVAFSRAPLLFSHLGFVLCVLWSSVFFRLSLQRHPGQHSGQTVGQAVYFMIDCK